MCILSILCEFVFGALPQERLQQMLKTEYDTLEASIREEKGAETRFFALATTLAAKALRKSLRAVFGGLSLQPGV